MLTHSLIPLRISSASITGVFFFSDMPKPP
jgi:hypothetical protein